MLEGITTVSLKIKQISVFSQNRLISQCCESLLIQVVRYNIIKQHSSSLLYTKPKYFT